MATALVRGLRRAPRVATGPDAATARLATEPVRRRHRPDRPRPRSRPVASSIVPHPTHDSRRNTGNGSKRVPPAYKPGSVDTPKCIGRSFLSACRHRHAPAAYPRFAESARRQVDVFETGRLSPPIWPCSGRGLPCHDCCQPRGGLLPHPFTLTAFSRRRRFAFCCTVRHVPLTPRVPRRYLATCPVEPGLSSEPERDLEGPSSDFATVRPTIPVPHNIPEDGAQRRCVRPPNSCGTHPNRTVR